jgi:hypothetical protein
MNSITRTDLLDKLVKKVQDHKQQTAHKFSKMRTSDLNRLSPAGGWSITQCLDHLNSYGNYYLPVIRQNLELALPDDDGKVFESGWLGRYFVKMMDPETGKKKYKAFKGHIPETNLDPAIVIQEFLKQQDELKLLLLFAANRNLSEIRIPVSICKFIRLKLGDVFQFLIAHNERHLQQATRNLQEAEDKRISFV